MSIPTQLFDILPRGKYSLKCLDRLHLKLRLVWKMTFFWARFNISPRSGLGQWLFMALYSEKENLNNNVQIQNQYSTTKKNLYFLKNKVSAFFLHWNNLLLDWERSVLQPWFCRISRCVRCDVKPWLLCLLQSLPQTKTYNISLTGAQGLPSSDIQKLHFL